MLNIGPAKIRRGAALCSLFKKCEPSQNLLLFKLRNELPEIRLKSKINHFVLNFSVNDDWHKEWQNLSPKNPYLVQDPCKRLPGYELNHRE